MGSFACTCCVSGLPIEAGDPVRYFMLTRNPYNDGSGNTCYMHDFWFPRVFPIRAVYNDYGSIEDVHEEDRWMKDLWLHGLQIDLVEQGWGDNSAHDVPTSKAMKFDDLLSALWEGRLLIERDTGRFQHDERLRQYSWPAGVPTLARIIDAVTKQAKFALFSGNYKKSGFMVDEKSVGYCRVRWHGAGKSYGKDVLMLQKLLPHLSDYATMIVAGSGAYAETAEIIVLPKPGIEGYHGNPPEYSQGPLPVGHAMIREDVWQALLTLKTERGLIENYRKDVRDLYPKFQTVTSIIMATQQETLTSWIFKDNIPFTVGLGTNIALALKKGSLPDLFLNLVAEFAFIHEILSRCRYQWRTSSCSGPQSGEWPEHAKLMKALLKVANAGAKKQKEEEASWK